MSSSAVPSLRQTAAPDTPELPARTPQSLADLLLYTVLGLLVYVAWYLSKLEPFAAGSDTSYWMGVAGGTMMLVLFTYPMRKHFRFMHGLGKVKWWFLLHMTMGVFGPLTILVHSNFSIGSLNAGVALVSMVIVALSGVVGRFIRVRVHRGLHGERTTLRALQAKAGFNQNEVRSRMHFAPEVEKLLQAFEQRELQARPTALTHLRQVAILPIQRWLHYKECVRALQEPLRQVGKHRRWNANDLAKRDRLARKLIRRYLDGVVRVAQFTAYERVFALWHVAHVPFVYLLVASAIVHVIAVHAY